MYSNAYCQADGVIITSDIKGSILVYRVSGV